MAEHPSDTPEPMSVDLSALGGLPHAPEDESSAALDGAQQKAGPAKLLGWALGKIAGASPLEGVEAALKGELEHRDRLAACADAAHQALGEAIIKADASRPVSPAPGVDDGIAITKDREKGLMRDLESRLADIDRDLAEVESASEHEDDGTNAVLAAMDTRSIDLLKKRMSYSGRGSVRAMVKIRRDTLLEERAKLEARLRRLLDRAKKAPAEESFPALAAKKRGGLPQDPLEVGRSMVSQAKRFKGGEVVELRLSAVKRLLEESAARARQLEEARKRLVAEAEAAQSKPA